jgi:hypothetical protein
MSTIFGGSTPSNEGNFGGNTGLDFMVNHVGNITGVWWYQPTGSNATVTPGLYDTETHTLLGTAAPAAGLPAGAWSLIALTTPVPVVPGKAYTVVCYQNNRIAWYANAVNDTYIFNSPFTVMNQGGRVQGGGALAFPTTFFRDAYAVDVAFTETQACPDCPVCPECPGDNPCVNVGGVDPVSAIAEAILACAYSSVDHDEDEGLGIGRVCMVPGDIAWDNCQCGQLVITENRRYGSRGFALEAPDLDAECGEPVLTVDFTISLTRCVPSADDNGDAPSCDALTTSARQLMKDKRDLRSAVMCCLSNLYDSHLSPMLGFIIQAQETVGPSGGCAGSELNFLVGFPNGCGC